MTSFKNFFNFFAKSIDIILRWVYNINILIWVYRFQKIISIIRNQTMFLEIFNKKCASDNQRTDRQTHTIYFVPILYLVCTIMSSPCSGWSWILRLCRYPHAYRTFALFRIVKWTGFAKRRKRIVTGMIMTTSMIGWESDGNWRNAPC